MAPLRNFGGRVAALNLFRIPNLSSNDASIFDPTSLPELGPYPAGKRKWKARCSDPAFEHYFLSGCAGLDPNSRVSSQNPPTNVCAIFADYDFDGPEELAPNFPLDLEPTYLARTFGGGVRLIYLLEEPILLGPAGIYESFLQEACKQLRLELLFANLDRSALLDSSRYYEIGREWQKIADPLPISLARAWLDRVGRRYGWGKEGVSIPFNCIQTILCEKYPDRWPGGWSNFVEGARGPRFWDDDADARSVLVRESGVTCFTGARGFIPWSDRDLLGPTTVAKFVDMQIGESVKGIYYDGRSYWQQLATGWAATDKHDFRDELMESGLEPMRLKGENAPETTRAMNYVRRHQNVAGVVPVLYAENGIIVQGGKKYLNPSNVRVCPPVAETSTEWGDGWPWLADYLVKLFGDKLGYFLAWLRHFYLTAYNLNLERGLTLILAGPVDSGKTFLTRGIIGQLMGGFGDAQPFLVGGDQYNDALVREPVWALDDIVDDGMHHLRFSKLLKRVTANDAIAVRAMHRSPVTALWKGRIIITCNDSPESLRVLPRTDIDILDKLLMLRVRETGIVDWPSDDDIAEELPFLGAWLRDSYTDPALTSRRFGVRGWADPELLGEAIAATPQASVSDVLQLWRADRQRNGLDTFRGSATEVYRQLCDYDSGLREVARATVKSPTSLGRFLSSLAADASVAWLRKCPGRYRGNSTIWEIDGGVGVEP